jgi:4-hydroxybenzoate polyprenyltransferase
MVLDVMVLAVLYTLRIIAGGVALAIPLSFWLLAFSMCIFLSLALVKRYAELFDARAQNKRGKALGRGYSANDMKTISILGIASGYMAVIVLAFYVNDTRTAQLYRHQELIWPVCPLLLIWISRAWLFARRGVMNEDPMIFAVRDRMSWFIGALIALAFWAAV